MVDKSIPFADIIMRNDNPQYIQPVLPEGFYMDTYQPGDEEAWAQMEVYSGDFKTKDLALEHFRKTFLPHPEELKKRFVIVRNRKGEGVCSCLAWRTHRNNKPCSTLVWLVTAEGYEGLGLARAVVFETVNRYHALGESPVWLHTQPWSYKAIWLYYQAGFRITSNDLLQRFPNRYAEAMPILETLIPEEKMKLLRESVLHDRPLW